MFSDKKVNSDLSGSKSVGTFAIINAHVIILDLMDHQGFLVIAEPFPSIIIDGFGPFDPRNAVVPVNGTQKLNVLS